MAFNQFPYSNVHELNLDWLLQEIKNQSSFIRDFAKNNTIKVHNPPEWNVTTQYPAHIIVIDGYIAYLAIDNVPAGVDITNHDYWLEIMDITAIVNGVIADVRAGMAALQENMDALDEKLSLKTVNYLNNFIGTRTATTCTNQNDFEKVFKKITTGLVQQRIILAGGGTFKIPASDLTSYSVIHGCQLHILLNNCTLDLNGATFYHCHINVNGGSVINTNTERAPYWEGCTFVSENVTFENVCARQWGGMAYYNACTFHGGHDTLTNSLIDNINGVCYIRSCTMDSRQSDTLQTFVACCNGITTFGGRMTIVNPVNTISAFFGTRQGGSLIVNWFASLYNPASGGIYPVGGANFGAAIQANTVAYIKSSQKDLLKRLSNGALSNVIGNYSETAPITIN